MLWIVLPFIIDVTAAIAADISAITAVAYVGVADKVVVVVNVDIVAAPAATPAPAASPRSPHCPTNSKRDRAGSNDSRRV